MVSIAGNTLQQIVNAVAPELGPFDAFTASASGASDNQVVVSARIDTEAPAEKYGGWYLYALTGGIAGQQQRVKRNGFTGSTGAYATAANFSGTPPLGGTWEAYGVMPRLDQDGLTGIRTCINRSIRKLWFRYWYPFTGVDGQTVFDLGALWWASRDRFIRLMDPDPGGTGHPPVSGQGWDVVQNGDVWELQLSSGYATGQTFWLVVDMPTNGRLRSGGTWANTASPTAGLSADTDACLGTWNEIIQCSLYECCKQLSLQAGGNRKEYWRQRTIEQRLVVAAIKTYQMNDDGEALGEGPSAGTMGTDYGDKGLFSGSWY